RTCLLFLGPCCVSAHRVRVLCLVSQGWASGVNVSTSVRRGDKDGQLPFPCRLERSHSEEWNIWCEESVQLRETRASFLFCWVP
ncbi:unnamed protein product, partial [Gulo gulo]